MFQACPGDNSTKWVADEVDPFVVVEGLYHVQSDLLAYCFAKYLQRIVDFIFDSFDK